MSKQWGHGYNQGFDAGKSAGTGSSDGVVMLVVAGVAVIAGVAGWLFGSSETPEQKRHREMMERINGTKR